jgi:hypothetical protein
MVANSATMAAEFLFVWGAGWGAGGG